MSVSAPEKSRVFARTAAVRLGGALLAGFAVVLLFAGLDRAKRTELESYQEVSAVGDAAYFPLPEERPKPPVPALVYQGQPLVPESYEPVEIRDTRMLRLGKDDSGQYSVYGNREGAVTGKGHSEASKNDKFLYIKIAQDEYLKTVPGKPAK